MNYSVFIIVHFMKWTYFGPIHELTIICSFYEMENLILRMQCDNTNLYEKNLVNVD